MVPVPPEGSIELLVNDPDTFALMTGTIVALPRGQGKKARFKIATHIDGQAQRSVHLGYRKPVRPRHPRPQKSIRFTLSRRQPGRPPALPDGGPGKPPPPQKEATLCLQLTTLVD